MEKFASSRLVGSPPGYVGFEEGGQLTEQVRRRPYSVVLFDEIEKAHPDVSNMLLQILEEGNETQGRTVDFRNTIILLTSNVGAESAKRKSIGFNNSDEDVDYEKMKELIMDEAKKAFRPEFLNRLDDVIVFHALDKQALMKILDLEIGKVVERLEKDINLVLDEKARDFLVEKGHDRVRRAADAARGGTVHGGSVGRGNFAGQTGRSQPIQVSADEDKLTFTQKSAAETAVAGD